ncbi:hypothetical protein [Lichenihabitans psoromatis]|uniref:hypothetical protein n=1 Tax=Lichenihabitans psoromatis TaxID=2528642 RepID=UPI0010383DF1|nr:hypothetical protein [Lichenihabitans psoromatis]
MFPLPRYPSSGRLTFPFEALYVTLSEGGTASHRPVYGQAVITYDGRGSWWPDAITLYARDFADRHTTYKLIHGTKVWLEVVRRLETSRHDEIAEAINTALARDGMHMVLFGEHLPPETLRRSPPPYVQPRTRAAHGFRHAAVATTRTAIDAAACVALVAGILALASSVEPHRVSRSTVQAASLTEMVFARLDGGQP